MAAQERGSSGESKGVHPRSWNITWFEVAQGGIQRTVRQLDQCAAMASLGSFGKIFAKRVGLD